MTPSNSLSMQNAARAAAFFRQPAWPRLLDALYEKYIALGRSAGQVVLHACSAEEQREIARFLKKRLPSNDTLVVRLEEFQQALNESGFPCELEQLLVSLYPERSHLTRPQKRKLRTQIQQRFYEDLSALANNLPAEGKGRRWLLSGEHGRDYLFRRYKNEDRTLQEGVLSSVHTVVEALDQLPTPPAYKRLSLFAQCVSGDPHCLDAQSFTGRLFLHALADLAHTQSNTQAFVEEETSSMEELMPVRADDPDPSEEDTGPLRARDHQRHLLYYEAGLLTDTISSTVSAFHLAYAEDGAGQRDSLLESAKARVLILSLRQLLAWKKLAPASEQVYLFENPQVFEDIVDELQQCATNISDDNERLKAFPTLICTSGWPSVAAIRLLNLLTETAPQIVLHYSGDFDLAGLRIASYVQKRYPAHCRLWHLDPFSYFAALHHKSTSLDSNDLAALRDLPASFAPLVTAIQETGKKAYQEGITPLLLQDILAAARIRSTL